MGFLEINKKKFFLILTKVDKYYNFQGEFFCWIMNIVEKGMLKKLQYFSEITKTSKIYSNIFYVFEIYKKNCFERIIYKIHFSQI